MKLSKNFPLKELIASDTAKAKNIDNRPGSVETQKLLYLCQFILQPTRNQFGRVDITSGYRCPELNCAIGSSSTSQHPSGEAGDFRVSGVDLREVFEWIRENLIFGQIIYEAPDGKEPWIHISLPRPGKTNQQAFEWDGKNYSIV